MKPLQPSTTEKVTANIAVHWHCCSTCNDWNAVIYHRSHVACVTSHQSRKSLLPKPHQGCLVRSSCRTYPICRCSM